VSYSRLVERFARIAVINEAQSVLGWDAAAMMPDGGANARGDQLAVLASLAHELLTSIETGSELSSTEALGDAWSEANLVLMRHRHQRATALPVTLVEAQERAHSACEHIWRDARRTNDFAAVKPYLQEVVRLAREAAESLGSALGLSPYNALMDGYQQGITASDAASVFGRYEAFLAEALPLAEARQARSEPPMQLPGPFPSDRQESLCRTLSARAGLDYRHARLDRSAHPFCGGTPTDVRITTRYDEADVSMALLGVMHETGHALYERGLPASHARQPVGEAAGMAVHESQSLIIEMQACRSDAYLAWLGPTLHQAFGGSAEPYAVGNLSALWRRAERGFIRTEADEMTYPAHIIMRFRLEQALINGSLEVGGLPEAWAEQSQMLLGITPPTDAQGCLQDIHWYSGAFGYFPSYTLGAMAAAQLFAAARRVVAGLDDALGHGDLQPLVSWLGQHVHAQGSRHGFNALLKQATGAVLDPGCFERHLRRRYVDGIG